MVVQSIALPKASGSPSDDERPVDTAAATAVVGSFHAPALVVLLVVTQGTWLALLGYAAVRFLG